MQVLSPTFVGRILVCDRCGALLNYTEADIYGTNLVYCPLCKNANTIQYDKNYDGVIKEKKEDVQS